MKEFMRYFRDYLREHAAALFVVGLVMGACGMFSMVIGFYGKIMVDRVVVPAAREGVVRWGAYAAVALAMAATWILYAAGFYIQHSRTTRIMLKVATAMRHALNRKLNELQLAYYDTHHSGRLVARLFSDIGMIQTASTQIASAMMGSFVAIAVNLAVMFYLNWRLALLSLVILPVYGVSYGVVRKRIDEHTRNIRRRNAAMWALVQERITNIEVVKAYNRERRESAAFFRLSKEQFREAIRRMRLNVSVSTLCSLVYYTGFVFIVYLGIRMLAQKAWSEGAFIWFNNLTLVNFPPLQQIVATTLMWRELKTNLGRFYEIMDEPVVIQDPPRSIRLERVAGEIRFLEVTFRYPGQRRPALEDIDLHIPAGSRVLIMGPSGAGKSTLVKLMQRLYDPDEGAILLDGHNLRDISLQSLRSKVVRVPQEVIIFSGTIAENIRYSNVDATNSMVVRAAKMAELHEFIMSLPEKYETSLGEMGLNLSGGQKQRLSLARALVMDPAVLILDDITSALDMKTAERIERTLEKVLQGRTSITITHRFSKAPQADMIIVMEDGRIVETGRHEELLAADGLYAAMFRHQQ